MIKVALIGYGKMGRAIEGVIHKIDENNKELLEKNELSKADVAIEFTTPHTAIDNIYKCFEAGVPVVVGSTGWYSRFDEVKENCIKNNKSMFTASNFSIGVNIFFEVNKMLARFMNSRPEYSATLTEIHHTEKKDAPSGTGITLAEGVIDEMSRYNKWVNNDTKNKNELPIISLREPDVPGTHIVQFDSEIDFIRIEHTAHSRLGFAQGAVAAAYWLVGKEGVFGMKDMLQLNEK
jgi:4-hydroxy-tetrahydrodipicolinate reductase